MILRKLKIIVRIEKSIIVMKKTIYVNCWSKSAKLNNILYRKKIGTITVFTPEDYQKILWM